MTNIPGSWLYTHWRHLKSQGLKLNLRTWKPLPLDQLAHSFCPLWRNWQYPTPTFLGLLWSNSNFRILCNLHVIQLQTGTSIKTPALLSISWFTGNSLKWSCHGSVKRHQHRTGDDSGPDSTSCWDTSTRLATLHQNHEARPPAPSLVGWLKPRGTCCATILFGRSFFLHIWNLLRLYAPAPAMDPTITVQAPTVWAN